MDSNDGRPKPYFVHVWSRQGGGAMCGREPAESLINPATLLATYDGPQPFLVCEDCLAVIKGEPTPFPD